MERPYPACDGFRSQLLSDVSPAFDDGRRGIGTEEREPVAVPSSTKTLVAEDAECLIAEVRLRAMARLGSAQDKCLHLSWRETSHFDRARSTDRVADHNDRAVSDCVEGRSGPVDELIALLVERRSGTVLAQGA